MHFGALLVFQCTLLVHHFVQHVGLVYKMGKTGAERLRESLERKKQKKKERNARFYSNNKERILEKRKEQRRILKRPRVTEEDRNESEAPKPNWQFYKARQRARQKAGKEKPSSKSVPVPSPNTVREAFSNRTARKRAIGAAKASLPRSPRKKLLSSLLSSKAPQQGSHCNNVAM